jgi:AcrR family transcriptional regulator
LAEKAGKKEESERPEKFSFEGVAADIDAFLKPEPDGPQARRRERILQAAEVLFTAHGYRKTSVDDIAGAAGVAKGTVYLYYSNKAELLLHVIALQKRQYLERMAPAFDLSVPPADRLRRLIRLGIQVGHELPLISRPGSADHEIEAVLEDADAATLDGINRMQIEYMVHMLDAATGHRRPRAALEARAQVLVDLIFAVVNGGRQVRQGMPLETYTATVAEIIVDGVAGEGPGWGETA